MHAEDFQKLTIVVCTRDRLGSLELFFESCDSLIANENIDFIVVDSSTPPLQLEDVDFLKKRQTFTPRIRLVYEEPGIPRARNRALKEIKTELVTFVDDDITLPQNFSEAIFEHFNEYPQTAGVGPRISGMYEDFQISTSDGYFAKIYKRRIEKSFGKVSRYGENFWFPENYSLGLTKCEWLPGCCMTYNFKVLDNLKFNTGLENGPGRSYAVGEDVDFSTRSSDFGPLYLVSSILINHREEASARDDRILMAKARGTFRAYLSYEGRISVAPALYHLVINMGASLLRLLLGKNGAWKRLKEEAFSFMFYLDELFSRTLKNEEVGSS
jgi:GT2 family glycosyltransferase